MNVDRKAYGDLHPVLEHTVQTLLSKVTGLSVDFVGRPKVVSSVNMRMRHLGIADQRAYARTLRENGDELTELVESVVIPETWFFRDRMAFQILRRRLGELLNSDRERTLRLLSVPCSTGEEAYSIAVCAHELGIPAARMQIDAMDVSRSAIARAEEAVYQRNSFRNNEPAFIRNYFQEISDGFRVKPYIRERVNFRTGNILSNKLVPSYDIILCRNLLIYFNSQTQHQALSALHRLLSEEGLLLLGHSENVVSAAELYGKHPDWPAYAFLKRDYLDGLHPAAPHAVGTTKNKRAKTNARPPLATRSMPRESPAHEVAAPSVSLDDIKQLADNGKLREARDACLAHIESDPKNASAWFFLAVVEQAGGFVERVETALRKTVYLDPSHYDALIMLSCLEDAAGHGDKAELLRRRAQRSLAHHDA